MAEGGAVVDFAAEVKRRGLMQVWQDPFWQGWDHQLLAVDWVKRHKRTILSIDKGMGKTSIALAICEDPEVHCNVDGFTVLIFTNEKGMAAYLRDIKKFPKGDDRFNAEEKIQLVYGTKEQRKRRWRNSKAKYFIVTYSAFLSDCGVRDSKHVAGRESIIPSWALDGKSIDAVFCDEFHRVFRSHRSKTFELFKKLFKDIKYFVPMSGSAVDKGPQDIWPALHLCDPKLWSSYWKYVYTWCEVEDSHWGGKKIVGPDAKKVGNWRKMMKSGYVFHVTADMVADMPPKTRDFMDCQISGDQLRVHNDFLRQKWVEIKGLGDSGEESDFHFAANQLVMAHKLRLTLICPKAIDPSLPVGQGIIDIAEDALEGGIKQYAIFTPFKAPLPFLQAYLSSIGANVWILQGGIGLDEQERRLAAWRASLRSATPDRPSIILSTIKYAESWEIPEARYGYFLGEEYVREDNLQAEDRLRRLISVGMTYIRYVRFKGTYQANIIDALLDKAANWRMMFKDWRKLIADAVDPKSQ
ncbi:helicase [Brevundimonas phage vB_BpoS-StAshley]|nr:helicase [Brevundimonas phage vB_BpoS-StAshley]